MLTEVTERALAHTGKNEVLITGGVAASTRLLQMMKIMCSEREAKCYVTPKKYTGDNGVMIAWTGILLHSSEGGIPFEKSSIKKNWRTDDVEITWQ
jgi:tRNA A37 threonylcarbamoyltransferase TsaD